MSNDRIDLDDGLEYNDAGDLVSVSGRELYGQRIPRMALMDANGLGHRPGSGGGMKRYQNRPPHPQALQQERNRLGRFLSSLPYVESYEVSRRFDADKSAQRTDIKARIDGAELKIRLLE